MHTEGVYGQNLELKQYPKEGHKEAGCTRIIEQNYSVADAAKAVGVNPNMLYNWKQKIEEEGRAGNFGKRTRRASADCAKKTRSCAWKGDIKRLQPSSRKKWGKVSLYQRAICDLSSNAIVSLYGSQQISLIMTGPICWAKLISAEELHLNRRAKALFGHSRESLGSRELMKKLREEGFDVGRNRVISLMHRLNLVSKTTCRPTR